MPTSGISRFFKKFIFNINKHNSVKMNQEYFDGDLNKNFSQRISQNIMENFISIVNTEHFVGSSGKSSVGGIGFGRGGGSSLGGAPLFGSVGRQSQPLDYAYLYPWEDPEQRRLNRYSEPQAHRPKFFRQWEGFR